MLSYPKLGPDFASRPTRKIFSSYNLQIMELHGPDKSSDYAAILPTLLRRGDVKYIPYLEIGTAFRQMVVGGDLIY